MTRDSRDSAADFFGEPLDPEEDFESFEDEYDDESLPERPPAWVMASVALNVLILIALLPFIVVLIFPPFAVYFVELSRMISWVSPLLLAGNVAALMWAFPRRRPIVTAFSLLGFAFLAISIMICVYTGQLTVFGIPLIR